MRQWYRRIGLVPQELAIYLDLSAQENVQFCCSLYGFSKNKIEDRIEKASEFVGLSNVKNKLAEHFSGWYEAVIKSGQKYLQLK